MRRGPVKVSNEMAALDALEDEADAMAAGDLTPRAGRTQIKITIGDEDEEKGIEPDSKEEDDEEMPWMNRDPRNSAPRGGY